VTYIRCRCQGTTRLCDNGSGCVTISHMILNRAIRRYEITDSSLIVLQPVSPLCDYKLWIDIERDDKAKHHLRNMVKLNIMEEEFHARGWRSVGASLTLPCSVRWIVRSIKRSERRRGHRSVRKHDVRMKCMLEVVRKRS
jgi:hypothetical protein